MTNEFSRRCADAHFQYLENNLNFREEKEEKSGARSLFQSVARTGAGKCCFIMEWLLSSDIRSLSSVSRQQGAVWLRQRRKSALFILAVPAVKLRSLWAGFDFCSTETNSTKKTNEGGASVSEVSAKCDRGWDGLWSSVKLSKNCQKKKGTFICHLLVSEKSHQKTF